MTGTLPHDVVKRNVRSGAFRSCHFWVPNFGFHLHTAVEHTPTHEHKPGGLWFLPSDTCKLSSVPEKALMNLSRHSVTWFYLILIKKVMLWFLPSLIFNGIPWWRGGSIPKVSSYILCYTHRLPSEIKNKTNQNKYIIVVTVQKVHISIIII